MRFNPEEFDYEPTSEYETDRSFTASTGSWKQPWKVYKYPKPILDFEYAVPIPTIPQMETLDPQVLPINQSELSLSEDYNWPEEEGYTRRET